MTCLLDSISHAHSTWPEKLDRGPLAKERPGTWPGTRKVSWRRPGDSWSHLRGVLEALGDLLAASKALLERFWLIFVKALIFIAFLMIAVTSQALELDPEGFGVSWKHL